MPIFRRTLSALVADGVGLAPDDYVMHNGAKLVLDPSKGLYFQHLSVAGVKGRERCEEKVEKEYGGDWSLIVDAVRCSIVVTTEAELLNVAKALATWGQPVTLLGGDAGAEATVGDFVLVRLKNRYKQPCFNGYQDALYSIKLCVGDGVWSVCEVQVHLAAVLVHKEVSHRYYEFMRTYFSGSGTYEARMALLNVVAVNVEVEDGGAAPDALVAAAFRSGDKAKLEALRELVEVLGDVRAVVAVQQRLEQVEQEAAIAEGKGRSVREELKRKVDMGQALKLAGQLGEAERVLRETVERSEAALQLDDMLRIQSVGFLANVVQDQGKLEEAERLHRRALAGYEAALGATHENTVACCNNLANNLYNQGKGDESKELYTRALQGNEAALGATHPSTLQSVNNLANILAGGGATPEMIKAAEALYRRALAAFEAALGAKHPDTLNSVNNLAVTLGKQGRVEEAEALYRRALAGNEEALGGTHPGTLASVENLAAILANTGKLDEAGALMRRALGGYQEALGPTHPDTIDAATNLGGCLETLGRAEEAAQLKAKYGVA